MRLYRERLVLERIHRIAGNTSGVYPGSITEISESNRPKLAERFVFFCFYKSQPSKIPKCCAPCIYR